MKYELALFDQVYFFDRDSELDTNKISIVIAEIKATAFALKRDEEVRLYIQNHQKALLNFKGHETLNPFCDQVLYFLETFFPAFINTSETVSEFAKDKLLSKYRNDLIGIHITLKNICSSRFLAIIQPVLLLEKDEHLTVGQCFYLKNFIPVFLQEINAIESEEQIHDLLIYSNFNTLKFANYINSKILSELNREDFLENQLMILLEKEKNYNQITISTNDAYEQELQPVTKQIQCWIEQEIKYCKKKLKNRIDSQAQIEFKSRTLFQTSMSVTQLACLFKSFREVEAINNPVQKDVFKAVADSFVTDHTKNISAESLYNKQYDIDDVSKEAVRQILRKMLKSIA